MTASRESTPPRAAAAAADLGLRVGSRPPSRLCFADENSGRTAGSASTSNPSPGPESHASAGSSAWSAPRRRRRRGSRASAPRRRHAPRPAASASPAGPASPPPPPLTSARERGGGHGSAGVGAARGRRPSALPLFTASGLRRDAGGTNGLHYPRGPAIVRRHQAATVVPQAGGLPSLAPPSTRFLPASAWPPPCDPAPAARARQNPPRRRLRRRPRLQFGL